jgi:Predicted transcriptional regulators
MAQIQIFWGQILLKLRKQHKLKQEDLAKVLHISRQDYSHIETGKVRPTPEMISILSKLYEKDLFTYALDSMPVELVNEQYEFKVFMNSGIKRHTENESDDESDKEP